MSQVPVSANLDNLLKGYLRRALDPISVLRHLLFPPSLSPPLPPPPPPREGPLPPPPGAESEDDMWAFLIWFRNASLFAWRTLSALMLSSYKSVSISTASVPSPRPGLPDLSCPLVL